MSDKSAFSAKIESTQPKIVAALKAAIAEMKRVLEKRREFLSVPPEQQNLQAMKNFEGDMIKAMDMAQKAINLKESVKLLQHLDKSIGETKKIKEIQARRNEQMNAQEAKATAPIN